MPDTADLSLRWEPDHTVDRITKKVRLTGASAITIEGRTVLPVIIKFDYTRYDGGTWLSSITIYADVPGSLIRTFFAPDKVDTPPQWLTDLIADAAPTR